MATFVDFMKTPIDIGDTVILIAPRYRHYVTAKVISFTPSNIRVAFMNNWNHSSPGYYNDILQSASQLIRVGGPELSEHIKK